MEKRYEAYKLMSTSRFEDQTFVESNNRLNSSHTDANTCYDLAGIQMYF